MSTFFDELLESVKQMDEVVKGECVLSREHNVDAIQGNETRRTTDLGVGTVIAANQPKELVLMETVIKSV